MKYYRAIQEKFVVRLDAAALLVEARNVAHENVDSHDDF